MTLMNVIPTNLIFKKPHYLEFNILKWRKAEAESSYNQMHLLDKRGGTGTLKVQTCGYQLEKRTDRVWRGKGYSDWVKMLKWMKYK